MSEIKNYQANDVIFNQQSQCDGVYIVAKGLVSISTTSQGKRVELAQLGRGSMFGEMAVIDLQSRSATATALINTEIVHVCPAEFQSNLHSLPLWAQLLIQMLVRRLRSVDEKITLYSGTSADQDSVVLANETNQALSGQVEVDAQKIVLEFKS